MRKDIPELKPLLAEVERTFGRAVATAKDFEELSMEIKRKSLWKDPISDSTLKRLWEYVPNDSAPTLTTLNILARYTGKQDFRQFCGFLRENGLSESGFFTSVRISASDLKPGALLRIGWNPDRLILLEYLGGCRFRIRKQYNSSSLREGDEFEAASFLQGQPLFLPRILRDGEVLPAYIAGKIHGLTTVESA